MRWIYLNIFLLAGLLTASGSSTTRSKRDINLLKNFFHSILPGTSKVPGFSNTFHLGGHDNIRIRVVPRSQPKVQVVQVNESEEAGILPPPPPIPPIIDEVSSYLGTNTAEDTLKALDGMKNLLASGILDAKKEEIANNPSAADVLSLLSAQGLKKGDEIVFIEDMIKPVNKVVYKPATLLFEHGILVEKPKIQAVEVLPTKYAPGSQYYYHQINNGGTTTYVETRPGGVMPAPPTLDNVKLPTITSDYLMLPPLSNRNPFELGIEIQESSKVTEESSSNMTKHPIMFLPNPQMLPLLQSESDVYVTDEISSSQINRRPIMKIPEPPSLTEVMVVPSGLSYEETIEIENKPVKVLNVDKYPNRFSYSYVGKNGQTIIYRGSKYNFSISEPVYEHVFPSSLYPIADYHSVKEISSEDFAGSVPLRQPYAFSYGIGMPTKFSSQIYAAETDKGLKVEDIVMVPGPAPIRQPYAFSYGVGMPPAMPSPIATVAAEVNKQGAGYEEVVVVPGAAPIKQGYAFSYGVDMPPMMMPPPNAPMYAAEVEKEGVVAMSGPPPIRQPYAFSYGIGLPPMMLPPSAAGYAAEVNKHESEHEDIVMLPVPAPTRQPYAFGYGIGMHPMMTPPEMAAVAAGTDKQESEHEDILMVPGPAPIRQPYAFSYGVGVPPVRPSPGAPMPPMYAAEIEIQDTEKEDVSMPGPAPVRQPYAFGYGVGMPPMMTPPVAAAIDVEADKQQSQNEEVIVVPGPAPVRQPYAFGYGVGMPPMMTPPVAAAIDVEADKQQSQNEEVIVVPGPAPVRQPYAFGYGVGMPPMMTPPVAAAIDVEADKQQSQNEEVIVVPGLASVRQPYAFGYGVGMPPMMTPPVAAAIDVEADKQQSENEEVIVVPGPAPVRKPYAFGYGVGMPSVLPPPGAPMPPMYASDQNVVVPGPTPMRQPYAFGYGVGMPPRAAATHEANKQESKNKEIVMVSHTAPTKHSYALSYGAAMSAPAYAPYASHYVPHPVPYMLPVQSGQHYLNINEQMYNSRLTQLCSRCGELPPHILTRAQRLANNPSGQVYGINPYAAYQPGSMTNGFRKVPYVNNVQVYEPEFPENNKNEEVNTNEDAAAEAPNAADSQELEPAENGQEESMTGPVQSSLDKMPIVVGDPVYEYQQMNSDGSSTHVRSHGNDHVSIDLETTEESATSPYFGETVY